MNRGGWRFRYNTDSAAGELTRILTHTLILQAGNTGSTTRPTGPMKTLSTLLRAGIAATLGPFATATTPPAGAELPFPESLRRAYTIFFTGGSTDDFFAGFRAVGEKTARLIEE